MEICICAVGVLHGVVFANFTISCESGAGEASFRPSIQNISLQEKILVWGDNEECTYGLKRHN